MNKDIQSAKQWLDDFQTSMDSLGIRVSYSDNPLYAVKRSIKIAEILFKLHPFKVGQKVIMKEVPDFRAGLYKLSAKYFTPKD